MDDVWTDPDAGMLDEYADPEERQQYDNDQHDDENDDEE